MWFVHCPDIGIWNKTNVESIKDSFSCKKQEPPQKLNTAAAKHNGLKESETWRLISKIQLLFYLYCDFKPKRPLWLGLTGLTTTMVCGFVYAKLILSADCIQIFTLQKQRFYLSGDCVSADSNSAA